MTDEITIKKGYKRVSPYEELFILFEVLEDIPLDENDKIVDINFKMFCAKKIKILKMYDSDNSYKSFKKGDKSYKIGDIIDIDNGYNLDSRDQSISPPGIKYHLSEEGAKWFNFPYRDFKYLKKIKFTGKIKQYYNHDGKLCNEIDYINGKIDGFYITYSYNPYKRCVTTYKNGKECGFEFYGEDGKIYKPKLLVPEGFNKLY